MPSVVSHEHLVGLCIQEDVGPGRPWCVMQQRGSGVFWQEQGRGMAMTRGRICIPVEEGYCLHALLVYGCLE